jgi:EAL and modified HD-GYP domain-containing signal transduction protein
MVLGTIELKKFLSILFAAQVGSDKPAELMNLSMSRARFAELIAKEHGEEPSTAFLTGMMSLIDAMLDEPIESIMNKLPLAESIKTALVEKEGILATYIAIVRCFENADWYNADILINELGLNKSVIPNLHHESVHWANQQMENLSS